MGRVRPEASSLEALQREMQAFLLGRESAVASRLAARPGLAPERRLGIYRHAYRARLADTLRDSFGHTAAFLGDEFDTLAARYVGENPSRHANLRWYGEDFPGWLSSGPATHPVVGELAALDRALRRAFDGADERVLGLADLAALGAADWDGLRLRLHPTCARLSFRYNTLALWHALDRDEAPPVIEIAPHPVDVFVWRAGQQPHFRSVAPFEACALDALAEGLAFGLLCERLAARFPETDVATQAGGLLRRWVDEGALAAESPSI